jgi:hypothetical protein
MLEAGEAPIARAALLERESLEGTMADPATKAPPGPAVAGPQT